ncbi:zinc finger protein 845-like [Trichogramma pretiosum]|uniref:zinc finger protein 845-like n=1 Tax=Trichogramma pretiosum TaxID=7493 RepID=UPI0006C947E8|nr:zinc finger protein 845-like [Trichogramma pretiosum]
MDKSDEKSEEIISHDNSSELAIVIEDEKKYVGNICPEAFALESSLIAHRDIIHKEQKDYSCDKGEKKFEFRSHLRRHLISEHRSRKDFPCDRLTFWRYPTSLTTYASLGAFLGDIVHAALQATIS